MLFHLPNLLSLARGVCAPVFFWLVLTDQWEWAFFVFCYAAGSDFVDGPLARYLRLDSPLGHRFDHVADVVFTASGLASLAWLSMIPWVLVVVQLMAFVEYTVNGPNKSGFRTNKLGQINGVLYFVLLGIPVTQFAMNLDWIPSSLIAALAWVLAGSTLLSLVLRLVNRYR